jgi:hypothetical protein
MVFVMSRRGIELGHRLLLLKRTQGEKVVVGILLFTEKGRIGTNHGD